MPRTDLEQHHAGEETEWFQRLPDRAKEDLRRTWSKREVFSEDFLRRRRRIYARYALEAAAVFVFTALWPMFPWGAAPGALVCGLAAGLIGARVRAGHYAYPPIAGVLYLVQIFVFGDGLYDFNVFGYVFLLACFGVLGLMHQLGRSDGGES